MENYLKYIPKEEHKDFIEFYKKYSWILRNLALKDE